MTGRRASSSATAKSTSPANGAGSPKQTAETLSKAALESSSSVNAAETSPTTALSARKSSSEASDTRSVEDESTNKAGVTRSGSTKSSSSRSRGSSSRSKGSASSKARKIDDEDVSQQDAQAKAAADAEDEVPEGDAAVVKGGEGDTIDGAGDVSRGQDMSGVDDSAVDDLSSGEHVEDQTSVRRQRSSSMKELAGLGLAHLGDGDSEVLMPRRSRRAAASPPPAAVPTESERAASSVTPADGLTKGNGLSNGTADIVPAVDDEDGDGDVEGVTRCVCGSTDENVGLMIQCETCKCWQHCICMGMSTEEDCPDVYFCEQCKPELHIPLLRLLGVLPAPRSHKKGAGRVNGKNPARDAAKELKEAKAAVALLASQNAERRKEGMEPLVANTAGRQKTHASPEVDTLHASGSPHAQGDPHGAGRRSPKRRSTMNSRDSMYGGWEAIPPGLLNEDEVWDEGAPKREDDDATGRKRKRFGKREDDLSPSPAASSATAMDPSKRRRMSSGQPSGTTRDGRRRSYSLEREENAVSALTPQGSSSKKIASSTGKVAGKANRQVAGTSEETVPSAVKPKQPNQYTYRKERAALAAASAANSANGRPTSPTPSPSKSGRRGGGSALREGSAMGSRGGTPAIVSSKGGSWGMPEHLSHLAHLLPSSQPEPLILHMPSTKGVGQSRSQAGHSEGTSRPSPHAFTILDLPEAPTKVRFPGKRMTLGEMRKRVRNISEYVTRTQLEAVERGKRMQALGIRHRTIDEPSPRSPGAGNSAGRSGETTPATNVNPATDGQQGAVEDGNDSKEQEGQLDVPMEESGQALIDSAAQAGESVSRPEADKFSVAEEIPLSMRLLDNLTRELIAFQQKFGVPPGSVTTSSGTTLAMGSSASLPQAEAMRPSTSQQDSKQAVAAEVGSSSGQAAVAA